MLFLGVAAASCFFPEAEGRQRGVEADRPPGMQQAVSSEDVQQNGGIQIDRGT